MSEWIEYDGSEDQIAIMLTTKKKFIVDSQSCIFCTPICLKMPPTEEYIEWLKELLDTHDVKHYLICNPHPLANMICQQAGTGQPVWIKFTVDLEHYGRCCSYSEPTTSPVWDLPNAEYSFTPFDELDK